jgi:hypothetical protein
MPASKLILSFLWRFVLIYAILIAPWPGWNETYSAGFRAAGNAIFGSHEGQRLLYFEPTLQTQGLASIDTRIVLANRDQADSSGKGPGRYLGIEPRSVGWTPTALIIALIVSTPLPWSRRLWGLLWGLAIINLFVVVSVWVYIWNESTEVSLVALSPFEKEIADALQYTLVTQLGISFTFPILVWALVLFRREDFAGVAAFGKSPRKQTPRTA